MALLVPTISPRLIPHPANETGVRPDGKTGGWFVEDIVWGGRVLVEDLGQLDKIRKMIYAPGPQQDKDRDPEPGQLYAQEIDVMRARYLVPLLETATIREAQMLADLKKKGRI